MVGVGLFTLPKDLSHVGYNQWLVPICLGILANITLIPVVLLCKRYPEDSLFRITEKLLGKFFGKIVNAILLLYGVVQVASITQAYLRLVQTFTLPQFTLLEPSILLYGVLISIVLGGIKSVARFCIIGFFFTMWMIYYTKWAFQSGQWLHVIPTFEVSGESWVLALHDGARSMFGYGLILFYYPYIINKRKAYLHTTIGIWIVVLIYVIVCIACVVYFSPWQLQNLKYPILNLFQAVQLPFVERIENFGTSLWVYLILSTGSAYLWVAKRGMDALLSKHKNRTWHLIVVAFLSWLLIFGPIPIHFHLKLFDEWSVYYGYGLLVLPLFLLAVHAVRHRKGGSHE